VGEARFDPWKGCGQRASDLAISFTLPMDRSRQSVPAMREIWRAKRINLKSFTSTVSLSVRAVRMV